MCNKNGKLAVIVPQSTMIGKTKYDQNIKIRLLKENTLDAVITLNPDTFYGIGVNPVIAIFTAGVPHNAEHLVTFVDFRDDGYSVHKHIGLVPDGSAKAKRNKLIQLLKGNLISFSNDFALKTTITADDEWLHSFYYFNETIPTDEDFNKTIQDYLAFKFDMTVHGRGDLFDKKKNLNEVQWFPFSLGNTEIFNLYATKSGLDKNKLSHTSPERFPYVTRSELNNGVNMFTSRQLAPLNPKNTISIGLDTQSVFLPAISLLHRTERSSTRLP